MVVAVVVGKRITRPLERLKEAMGRAQNGDLSTTCPVMSRDELGDVTHHFNHMLMSQKDIVAKIQSTATSIDGKSGEIDLMARELAGSHAGIVRAVGGMASGTHEQAEDLTDLSMLVSTFSDQVEHVATITEKVQGQADQVNDQAATSGRQLSSMNQSIGDMKAAFEAVQQTIHVLVESIQQVTQFTEVINVVSEKTNLLALNAAIEAARAGDAGRGFAVVAEEIRALAVQVKVSSREIADLVASISGEAARAVQSSEEGKVQLADQLEVVVSATRSFEGILTSIQGIVPQVRAIHDTTAQINDQKSSIFERIQSATAVSEEVSATAQEISFISDSIHASTDQLNGQSSALKAESEAIQDLVDVFRIDIQEDDPDPSSLKKPEWD